MAVVLAAVVVGSAGAARPGAGARVPPVVTPGGARVGDDVLRALEHRREVPVLVTLRQAASQAAGAPVSRQAIAAARSRVLAGAAEGVDAGIEYAAVPAFSALVTRAGLEHLRRARDVAAIDVPSTFQRTLADGVALIRASEAHAAGYTGAGVTVAVLDSGVDATHPDLADDVVAQACFVRNADGTGGCPDGTRRQIGPGSAPDGDGHGTAVAGIITSRGLVASSGVAPDADVVAIKVFPDGPDSESDARDALAALDWLLVARPDVRVVNLSLGSSPEQAPCDTASAGELAYASAFAALKARGVTVVASSGNDGSTTGIAAPACVGDAISVGAVYDANVGAYTTDVCTDSTTGADVVACYSNGGDGLDVLAPGPSTVTAKAGGGTEEFGGTSAAAPFVTGVAALLLQARPGLGPAELAAALRQSGKPILDPRTGRITPRVDARAALDLLPTIPDRPARQALPAGSAQFADATGDGGSGADIAGVTVSTTGTGLLTFGVALANRSSLGPTDAVQVVIDADRNAATGSPTGAEHAIIAFGDGDTEVRRWADGWQLGGFLDTAGFGGNTLTVTVDEARIGGAASDFAFTVATYANLAGADVAPATSSWPYPAYTLGVGRSGTGSGTVTGGGPNGVECGARCRAAIGRGAAVTLTATPAAGSAFAGWGGACAGTGTCALTMDAGKEVSARFELLRRVTVSRTGTGAGSVTSMPAGIACGATCGFDFANGTAVTLSAAADPGSAFSGWSGACSGPGACTLTLEGAVAVAASFRDVEAPRAAALAGSGRRGRAARLRYRLSDNSGLASAVVTVTARGRRLGRVVRPRGRVGPGTAIWRIPSRAPRRLRFCVQPIDAAGNRGRPACAPLVVR